MNTINEFTGKYFFLSNYYQCRVEYNGYIFDSAEAAFQSQKNPTMASLFVGIPPNRAKSLGRRVDLRTDWEDVKIDVMRNILQSKFSNIELRSKLIKTYPCVLIEGNTWGDTFWGVDMKTNIGKNTLGILLAEIRNEFMKGS